MDNISFTSNINNNKLYVSEFDMEETPKMVLYAFLDNQTAMELSKYCCGLKNNITSNYKKLNPLQVPIVLYETPYIAKLNSAQNNNQLVAFDVNTNNIKVYDEFDIGLHIKLKQSNISLDTYKSTAILLRERKLHNKYSYIAYTVKDKQLIKDIQLQDYTEQ